MSVAKSASSGCLLRSAWSLAGVCCALTVVTLLAAVEEPFWCLELRDVLELLLLPGMLAAGWLATLALLVGALARQLRRRTREAGGALGIGLGATLATLPFVAGAGLYISTGCAIGYLGDLERSPALLCADMPDYGRCFEREPAE
jgi:hypothetical protein